MSDHDDEDFTQIKDLPNIERSEEDEDFSDLDSMAKDLGFDDKTLPSTELDSLENQGSIPDLPESNADEFSEETDFEVSEFNSPVEDFSTQTNFDDDSAVSDDFSTQSDFSNDSFDSPETFQTDEDEDEEKETHFEDTNLAGSLFTDNPEETSDSTDSLNEETFDNNFSDNEPSLTPQSVLDETIESLIPEKKTEIQREDPIIITPPEDFEEVKSFANNLSFGDFSAEGNPPFSIIIKDLKYYEDIKPICEILLELKFITPESAEETKNNLERGQILIPRLSEYAAIILSHKLRMFDLEVLMGLTEEIHPPKSYQSNDRGLTSKSSLINNKNFHKRFNKTSSQEKVLTTTLSSIDGYAIKEYLGVITKTVEISPEELKSTSIEDDLLQNISKEKHDHINSLRLHRENILAANSSYQDIGKISLNNLETRNNHSLNSIYEELIQELKLQAKLKEANGIVGINFSITPIGLETYLNNGPKYQILCSGNIVWLQKK